MFLGATGWAFEGNRATVLHIPWSADSKDPAGMLVSSIARSFEGKGRLTTSSKKGLAAHSKKARPCSYPMQPSQLQLRNKRRSIQRPNPGTMPGTVCRAASNRYCTFTHFVGSGLHYNRAPIDSWPLLHPPGLPPGKPSLCICSVFSPRKQITQIEARPQTPFPVYMLKIEVATEWSGVFEHVDHSLHGLCLKT